MKSFQEELVFNLPTSTLINITEQVKECLKKSGIHDGLLLCNAMHTTGSVFITDNDMGIQDDFRDWLEKLAPHTPHDPDTKYKHNVGHDNADGHLKRQIMGREVVVAVTAGKLQFGPWEHIFYGEFDGWREKRILVKVIGETANNIEP
jgi:secondary thiamine-phosphate synthase enzyme